MLPPLFIRFPVILLVMAFLTLGLALRAEAGPVIPGGKEKTIVALFSPAKLGGEVSSTCKLDKITIHSDRIKAVVVTGKHTGKIELTPPRKAPSATDTASFSVTFTGHDKAAVKACLGTLRDHVNNNDDGQFWQVVAITPKSEAPAAGQNNQESAASQQTTAEQPSNKSSFSPPRSGKRHGLVDKVWRLGRDGLLRFGLFVLTMLTIFAVSIRRDGLPYLGAITGISLGAWALRAWLSPQVAMSPGPYSRIIASASEVYNSDLLMSFFPTGIGLPDLIFGSVWVCALLAPLAVYLHARYLLATPQRAVAVAFILAVLPLHIRFSHSDTAFIPSITTTAIVFALIHIATREKHLLARLLALLCLAGGMVVMFNIRPLNIMYMPLLLGTCVIRGWSELDKRWVVLTALLVSAVTFGYGVPNLLHNFSREVHEGLSLSLLSQAVFVLFDWQYNILLNPMFTPTGILALAIFGGRSLYKTGERNVVMFLVIWLLLFLVAHAFIVPLTPAMQARYHLHLLTPFIMLAGCGLVAVKPLGWRLAILTYLLAAPFLHASVIGDIEYNDMQEFHFVRRTAHRIPDNCTVIEYTGRDELDNRYRRMTFRNQQNTWQTRINSVPTHDRGILKGSTDRLVPAVRELVEQPPECMFLYIGLACEGMKKPDEQLHPACTAMMENLRLELVAEHKMPSRPYDARYSQGYANGIPKQAQFRLFRVKGRQ